MTKHATWLSVLLVASVVVMPLAWSSDSHAQTGSQGKTPMSMSGQKTVEGAIKSVDQGGNMVTLDDGTKLVIPNNVKVPRGDLKAGNIVKASFEEIGGQNMVTELDVQSPR